MRVKMKEITKKLSIKELRELLLKNNSFVFLEHTVQHLAIMPSGLSDTKLAVKEELEASVNKFDSKLNGIILGYENVQIIPVADHGNIFYDDYLIHIDVEANFYVFRPQVGCTFTGTVIKKSHHHISCLIHSLFHVSIPSSDDSPNWIGNKVRIGQEITTVITLLNLTGRIPYICGKIESVGDVPIQSTHLNRSAYEDNDDYDDDSVKEEPIDNDFLEVSDTEESNNNSFSNSFEKSKKKKNKNIESNSEDHMDTSGNESPKKKKKKKDKKRRDSTEGLNLSLKVSASSEDLQSIGKGTKTFLHNSSGTVVKDISDSSSKCKKVRKRKREEVSEDYSDSGKKIKLEVESNLSLPAAGIQTSSPFVTPKTAVVKHKSKKCSGSEQSCSDSDRSNSRNKKSKLHANMQKEKAGSDSDNESYPSIVPEHFTKIKQECSSPKQRTNQKSKVCSPFFTVNQVLPQFSSTPLSQLSNFPKILPRNSKNFSDSVTENLTENSVLNMLSDNTQQNTTKSEKNMSGLDSDNMVSSTDVIPLNSPKIKSRNNQILSRNVKQIPVLTTKCTLNNNSDDDDCNQRLHEDFNSSNNKKSEESDSDSSSDSGVRTKSPSEKSQNSYKLRSSVKKDACLTNMCEDVRKSYSNDPNCEISPHVNVQKNKSTQKVNSVDSDTDVDSKVQTNTLDAVLKSTLKMLSTKSPSSNSSVKNQKAKGSRKNKSDDIIQSLGVNTEKEHSVSNMDSYSSGLESDFTRRSPSKKLKKERSTSSEVKHTNSPCKKLSVDNISVGDINDNFGSIVQSPKEKSKKKLNVVDGSINDGHSSSSDFSRKSPSKNIKKEKSCSPGSKNSVLPQSSGAPKSIPGVSNKSAEAKLDAETYLDELLKNTLKTMQSPSSSLHKKSVQDNKGKDNNKSCEIQSEVNTNKQHSAAGNIKSTEIARRSSNSESDSSRKPLSKINKEKLSSSEDELSASPNKKLNNKKKSPSKMSKEKLSSSEDELSASPNKKLNSKRKSPSKINKKRLPSAENKLSASLKKKMHNKNRKSRRKMYKEWISSSESSSEDEHSASPNKDKKSKDDNSTAVSNKAQQLEVKSSEKLVSPDHLQHTIGDTSSSVSESIRKSPSKKVCDSETEVNRSADTKNRNLSTLSKGKVSLNCLKDLVEPVKVEPQVTDNLSKQPNDISTPDKKLKENSKVRKTANKSKKDSSGSGKKDILSQTNKNTRRKSDSAVNKFMCSPDLLSLTSSILSSLGTSSSGALTDKEKRKCEKTSNANSLSVDSKSDASTSENIKPTKNKSDKHKKLKEKSEDKEKRKKKNKKEKKEKGGRRKSVADIRSQILNSLLEKST